MIVVIKDYLRCFSGNYT